MKQKIKTTLIVIALSVSGSLAGAGLFAQPAFAATSTCDSGTSGTNVGNAAEGDCAKETVYSFNGKKTNVGIYDLLIEVFKFLNVAVGIAVVTGIIIGGIVYSTAGGSPAKVKKGGTIIGSAVGALLLYLLMYAIINFLLPKGTLNL